MLRSKSETTGVTMSDILDKLIKAAFKPKRGLAKRIAKDKAKAESELQSATSRIDQELASAKAKAESELAIVSRVANEELTRLDFEWSESLQAKLLWMRDQDWSTSGECPFEHLSYWLFTRKVFAIQDRSKWWRTGLGLAYACRTWMSSDLLPDKLLAADLVAETEMLDCPDEVYDYLITSFYNGSTKQAFADFCVKDRSSFDPDVEQPSFEHEGFLNNLLLASELLSGLEQHIEVRKGNTDLLPGKTDAQTKET
jgi:hypothetical protein